MTHKITDLYHYLHPFQKYLES